MRRVLLLLCVLALGVPAAIAVPAAADGSNHEVWVVDQSDTRPEGGGTLYIYSGDSLAGRDAAAAAPEVIDLGGAAQALCLAQTGTAPRRPHMIMFNGDGTHAVLSYVATGHVLFIDAASRAPVGCVDVGAQAHAAFPSPDGTRVIVANQNGKLLQRISTDYGSNAFALEAAATVNLATCTTPNGAACEDSALRPDNAPICPVLDGTGRFAFVTLRGGGLLVVDVGATPMAIVAEYDREAIHPNGCGGVEANGKMYITSGGGTPANPTEFDVYALPMSGFSSTPNLPNTPAPALVVSRDSEGFVDSHGAALMRGGRYLWIGDRAANRLVVVDTLADAVVGQILLAGGVSPDPAPDLLAVSPSGNRVYAALRGPTPLTANVAGVNNAVGATPGVGVVRVEADGARGTFQAVARISHVVAEAEIADPHAIGVRPL